MTHTRWYAVRLLRYDPIQGQGQRNGGLKVANMADFKVSPPSASMHAIKRLMVNYDITTQCVSKKCTNFETV